MSNVSKPFAPTFETGKWLFDGVLPVSNGECLLGSMDGSRVGASAIARTGYLASFTAIDVFDGVGQCG